MILIINYEKLVPMAQKKRKNQNEFVFFILIKENIYKRNITKGKLNSRMFIVILHTMCKLNLLIKKNS